MVILMVGWWSHSCLRMVRHIAVGSLVLTLLSVATPEELRASEGEAAISLSSGYTQLSRGDRGLQFGAGAQALATVGVSDFFALRAGAETAYLFERDFEGADVSAEPLVLQNVFAGLRYNLDIFEYVPYVALSIVMHQQGPPSELGTPPRSTLGAKASIGLDWRMSRYWSVGGRAELHSALSAPSRFPAVGTLQGVLSYHFRL